MTKEEIKELLIRSHSFTPEHSVSCKHVGYSGYFNCCMLAKHRVELAEAIERL